MKIFKKKKTKKKFRKKHFVHSMDVNKVLKHQVKCQSMYVDDSFSVWMCNIEIMPPPPKKNDEKRDR